MKKSLCPKNCPIRARRQEVAKLFDLKIEAHEKEDRKEIKFTQIGK